MRDPDPRTYWVAISREDFRRLPMRNVLVPTLDGPVLVFRGDAIAWAELHKDDLEQITEILKKAARVMPPKRVKGMLARARRLHVQRVDLAIGYTWPRNPPGYIEFAANN